MDTFIHVKVVTSAPSDEVQDCMERVMDIFSTMESTCSRFDQHSELSRLSQTIGVPVQVSPILFEALYFSIEVAKLTYGVFDPTIGQLLIKSGFDRNYVTGDTVHINNTNSLPFGSYQDIEFDSNNHTVTLHKPVILDLGAVVKGLAIDLAAKELSPFESYYIDAGGDLFVHGLNEQEEPWKIGIQHPLQKEKMVQWIQLTEGAICTSGGYERRSRYDSQEHHLINPYSGRSNKDIISCSVVAPFTMMADAFSTVAILLGFNKGKKLLEEMELEGLWINSSLEQFMTNEMKVLLYEPKK